MPKTKPLKIHVWWGKNYSESDGRGWIYRKDGQQKWYGPNDYLDYVIKEVSGSESPVGATVEIVFTDEVAELEISQQRIDSRAAKKANV